MESVKRIYVLPVDHLIELAGNGHTFQVKGLIIMSIQWMLQAFFLMGFPLLFVKPTFRCQNPEDSTKYFQCTEEQVCSNKYKYQIITERIPSTVVNDFELICDQSYQVEVINFLMFLGGAVGAFYYTEIQESKGRLHVIVKSINFSALLLIVCSFSWSGISFGICAFLVHFGFRGHMTSTLVYISEVSSENIRHLSPMIFHCFWAIGQTIVAGLIYTIPSWRMIFFYLTAVPLLLTSFMFKFMNESPRYLVSKKRFIEAKEAILNMFRVNKRENIPHFEFEEEYRLKEMNQNILNLVKKEHDQTIKQEPEQKHSMISLFKYKSIKKQTINTLVAFLIINLAYFITTYGVNLYVGDTYFNLCLFGLVEIIAYLCSAFISLNYTRRGGLKALLIISGVGYSLFSLIYVKNGEEDTSKFIRNANILLACVGKFGVSGAMSLFFVYITELYPTSVRHFALGFFAVTSRLILIIIPPYLGFFQGESVSPLVPVGIACFVAIYFVKELPETLGKELKENLDEEEDPLTLALVK